MKTIEEILYKFEVERVPRDEALKNVKQELLFHLLSKLPKRREYGSFDIPSVIEGIKTENYILDQVESMLKKELE